jgi:tRNA1(Val) A37 N6-methylase TrmN6
LVAKYIYTDLVPENGIVFDYSAGFGHRMLGALSSPNNIKYVACDPWTAVVENNKSMAKFVGCENRVKIWNCGSEKWNPPEMLINNVDLAFSSPPYFDKEVYDNGTNGQAYENRTFEQFINEWWKPTLTTIKKILKPNTGLLAINMVEPMINDLLDAASEFGFVEMKRYHLQLSRSHFEKTPKLGDKKKGTFKAEPIVVLKMK